jgi:16S rRNA (guanine527-N7)-methyltransferase
MSERLARPVSEPSDEITAKARLQTDFDVSRETMDALERYRILLLKWAGHINLVGPSTLVQFWQRHILDSAQILMQAGTRQLSVADFGSGAGLPGLVLAALINDKSTDYKVHLVEASAKRCGFLREAARTLDIKAEIIQQKIEDVSPIKVDLVTARAFAPLEKLLGYASPWAQLGARIIFLKGSDVQSEIDEASTKWAFQSRINKSLTDPRGCVVEILDLRRQ